MWLDGNFALTPKGMAMAQRCSEYARINGDTYVTPDWVYGSLSKIESFRNTWDPAPVNFTTDFLKVSELPPNVTDIVTNPPFSLSEKFVRHALSLTQPGHGKVAMLLPHTWDTAKGRTSLFTFWPFKAKYVLTKRIRWSNLEQKAAGPSTNHAWYIWDWEFTGEPKMGWLDGQQSN